MCCCSCPRRTKVLLVGVSDLICGVTGLTLVAALVPAIIFSEIWLILSSFLILVGIFTVFAGACRNGCCVITSTIFRFIWLLFWMGVTLLIILLVIWYDYFNKELWISLVSMIAPGLYTFLQLYFIHVVLNYRKNELKGDDRETSSASPSFEFSPLTATQPKEDLI